MAPGRDYAGAGRRVAGGPRRGLSLGEPLVREAALDRAPRLPDGRRRRGCAGGGEGGEREAGQYGYPKLGPAHVSVTYRARPSRVIGLGVDLYH